MAEVPSRYHFAAHMGQLISGIEGQGCHNFYPTCPLPGISVLNMMKKIRLRWAMTTVTVRMDKYWTCDTGYFVFARTWEIIDIIGIQFVQWWIAFMAM